MDHYISREKTIEAIKTDLSQFVYDEYGNMTALGVRLIHRIGNITGCEPFGNLIDRDELVKDIEGQTERGGRTSSDVIAKGVLEVFLDYIRNFPSARPVNETVEHDKGDLISREATIADLHTADIPDEWMAWIDNFINVQPSVDPEQKSRECASCKHSNNGECAYTEECHKCMWESQYERQVEPERKLGKWIRGKYWNVGIGMGEQYGYFYKCSECGKEVKGGYTECTDRFCKSCGAKMEVDG